MKRRISRRDFVKAAIITAGGAAAAGLTKIFGPEGANAQSTPTQPEAFLPVVMRYEPTDPVDPPPPPSGSGGVVHVRSNAAHDWRSGSDYWNHVSQSAVDRMVDRGITEMTGKPDVQTAWRSLMPNYEVGQKVVIKLSLNNCKNFSGSNLIDAVPEPVAAIIRGLRSAGVAEDDIYLTDAFRYIPTRFRDRMPYKSVQLIDQDSFDPVTWETNSTNRIAFTPPGVGTIAKYLSPKMVEAHYLINVPIMKRHGFGNQVSLGFKNHFGSFWPRPLDEKSGNLHLWTDPTNTSTYKDYYSPYIDLFNHSSIRAKTILTVGDALFASKNHTGEPGPWSTFGNQTPKSLFFSTDPVAIDCVMADFCVAEMPPGSGYEQVIPSHGDYLKLAAARGWGVHERVNPWNNTYKSIKYRKFEIS